MTVPLFIVALAAGAGLGWWLARHRPRRSREPAWWRAFERDFWRYVEGAEPLEPAEPLPPVLTAPPRLRFLRLRAGRRARAAG